MNQNLMSIFSVVVNEKTFQFIPANSSFDEVMQALEQLKEDFIQLKAEREEAEAKEKAEKAGKDASEESAPLEPEIVNA